jgi:hypothetical protein
MLLGFIPSLAPRLASAAPRKSALKVLSVLAPVPPGGEPGSQMSLRASVKANVGFGRPAEVSFYLAQDPFPGPNDVPIGSTTVSLLPVLFAPGTVGVAVTVPQGVAAGFYYVLACSDTNNCAASAETVAIISQELSAVASPGTTSQGAPAPEYFPESTPGMSVGDPLNCPGSGHGQSPSKCVWVTTQQVPVTESDRAVSLFYCPIDNPYPFQVFFGYDPMWEDLSEVGLLGHTLGVSFTKYKLDLIFRLPLSYGGDPRGYATFYWACGQSQCKTPLNGRVRYLCTNKKARDAIP